MKKITLLFLFVLVGMQAFAQPSTITITAPTDATSVRITGPWWGWNVNTGPLATKNTDGTWLISLTSSATAMEYLIVVDGVQENLIDNAQGGECTARADAGNINTDNNTYANRLWLPTDGVDYSETYDDCSQMVFPDTGNSTPITLPLDFSDDNQLFTYVGNGNGGSVVMETGKMRFNGNGQVDDQAYLDLTTSISLMDTANNTITVTMEPIGVPDGEVRTHLFKVQLDPLSGAVRSVEGQSIGSAEQQVTFNFGNEGADTWGRIILFMDFNTDKVTDYLISSITLGADPVEPEVLPTTAAPSPTNSDVTILSIYNDTGSFTGVSQVWSQEYDFGTNQGNKDLDPTDGVNNALKMDFSLSGWGAGAAIRDISNQTHLHFDYFAPAGDAGTNGHEFKFIIIGDGQGEKDYFFKTTGGDAVIEFGQWVSVDIPLSHYEALGFTKDKFLQYKLGSTSVLNTKVVYFDNIYFYNEANLGLDSSNAFSMSLYPNPAKGTLNISAKNTIENATIYNVLGKKIKSFTVNAKTSSLDVSGLSRGIYILKYTANNAVGSMKFVKE
jgi:hypothetical protein